MKRVNFKHYYKGRGRRIQFFNKSKKKENLRANQQLFEIGSWDVEEKGTPEEIDKTLTELMKQKLDVVCLQRACLPASNTETENYKWLCNGTSGSAILLKKSAKLESSSFEQFCDQICMAELTAVGGVKMNVISCYIPPETDYTSEELWTKLKEITGNISPQCFVLAGDFSAQIGKDDVEFYSQTEFYKKRLYHESSNANGKKLADLMKKCHLRPFLPLKKVGSQLFNFKDGNVKSQQSYIFVSYSRLSFSEDGKIVWHFKYNHGLICCDLIHRPSDTFNFEIDEEKPENKPPVTMASWNIQNSTPAKIDSVGKEHNLPIICIQELFLTSDDDIHTDNYTWLSPKKLWAKNVGILIRKSPNIEVSSFEPHSEFLCTAKVLYFGKPLIVISSYLPEVNDPQHEQVVSYTKQLTEGVSEEDLVLFGGDFTSALISQGDILNADDFVQNLAKETKLSLADQKNSHMSRRVTQLTDTDKRRSHYILLSESAVKTMDTHLYFRWVPFFENMIICVTARDSKDKQSFLSFDKINRYFKAAVDTEIKTVDGVRCKTLIYKHPSPIESEATEDIITISDEDKEKFKNTPPSAEDLGRMLKDFVFIHKATLRSNIISDSFPPLSKSFSECKLGHLSVEQITEPGEKKERHICRIKWQGILLAEEISTTEDTHINLLKKAALSVVAKISQTCYTIKAKKSFFHMGMKPLLMDTPELADFMKKVDKSAFSNQEELFKHIDNFINEDNDTELVFGPEFPQKDLFEIAEYALTKNGLADLRFFQSKYTTVLDHLAVFRKRSPQYIRDKLIKEPKNFKYYLIPPCGLGQDYLKFREKYTATIHKEDSNLLNKYRKDNPLVKKPVTTPRGENVRNKPGTARTAPRVEQSRVGRKRTYSMMNSRQNGSQPINRSFETSFDYKRPMLDDISSCSYGLEMPLWSDIRPLVIVWPINNVSLMEDRAEEVLLDNFNVEFRTRTEKAFRKFEQVSYVIVSLTHCDGYVKSYCIAKGKNTRSAAKAALDLLVRHCTIIKPKPSFLNNGRTPNFIRYKIPCQLVPRSYLLLERRETGRLTPRVVEDLIDRFLNSYEEDMYFDRFGFTIPEKRLLLEMVPKLAPKLLSVRHFGEEHRLADRYICVYKSSDKQKVLQEVLKLGDDHPKYRMVACRLPQGIDDMY